MARGGDGPGPSSPLGDGLGLTLRGGAGIGAGFWKGLLLIQVRLSTSASVGCSVCVVGLCSTPIPVPYLGERGWGRVSGMRAASPAQGDARSRVLPWPGLGLPVMLVSTCRDGRVVDSQGCCCPDAGPWLVIGLLC